MSSGRSEPPPGVLLVAGLISLFSAAPARSAPAAPDTPGRALAVARAAFEYRDFDQVVEALDPWVHPPRIRDREQMIEARRLLGVSLHVLGEERAAREEFAQLLLLDPDHTLDPFVIPPRVIATFEEVRKDLQPRLSAPPELPGQAPPQPARTAPHPVLLWMPLGVPQIALDDTETGLLLGLIQIAGLAVNVAAFFRGQALDRPSPAGGRTAEQDIWLGAQYGGLAVAALAYGGSVVYGHAQRDAKAGDDGTATSIRLRGAALTLRF